MKLTSVSSNFTRATLASLLLLTALPPLSAQAQNRVQLVDRIVAVVNDEVITRHELSQQKAAVVGQLKKQGVTLPPDAELDSQVLERFINERVQLQYARDTGVRVDEVSVNSTLQRVATDNKMTMPQFTEALKEDGLTLDQFRSELRNQMLINNLRSREVESLVVVTDAEIDGFLATAKAQGADQPEYSLAHILILVPEQATPDQIEARKKRAEEAERQLKSGTSFAQVAAVFSDSNDATQGGALGWRPADRLPQLYAEAAAKLSVGSNSEVLRSANGFHIVRLIEKRKGSEEKTLVKQHKVRHILARVNDLTSEVEAKNKIERLRDRILGGESFTEVAKLNSEDGSAPRGGELGWISPGETVPDFENAMKAAAINTLVGPIRSQFGFHLIEVTEVRDQDVTRERTRQSARQAIRERKGEEAYQSWLRELRDRATVEVKLVEN